MSWNDHLANPAAIAVIAGSSAAAGAVGGLCLTSRVDYFARNCETDIKMVEIAVGILRSDAKKEPGLAPARAWATDVSAIGIGLQKGSSAARATGTGLPASIGRRE